MPIPYPPIKKTNYAGSWTTAGYPEAASLTTAQGSNKDLTFTSTSKSADGNTTTIRYVNPGTNNAALSVSVSTSAITVNLATDGSAAATSTASQIRTAVNASTPASALVTAELATGSTGAGVPAPFTATALTGGRSEIIGRGPRGWTVKSAKKASRIF